MEARDVVVIGAGPSGIAAAIQLRRYRIEPLVLEREEIGGLLPNANLVENYPGFPEGISGPALGELFKEQMDRAGAEVRFDNVNRLEHASGRFSIETDGGSISSRIAVIATGTKPREIEGLKVSDDIGDRVFHEVHPLLGVHGKRVAIVGAGDAAFDYALNMARRNDVVILNRSDRARCIPVLRERCERAGNISYKDNTAVEEMGGAGKEVLMKCISGEKRDEISADYVIIAVGREPCIGFLGSGLKKDIDGLIDTKALYLVGDVTNGIYRQTAICVGDGVRAAMEIHRSLGQDDS
ncbi:MAG: NAD(P)/FAD-dependent oxidoreductase [Candidatus Krumholzibacteria bacterium]|nr:NAD(P)/FAD-dependent oxidoreductase [Candidatus Krumholzibacteria bacterium]